MLFIWIAQRFEEARQEKEQERQRAKQAEQARCDAIPRLLGMGLNVEQVAKHWACENTP